MGEGCNPNKRIQTSNGRKCIENQQLLKFLKTLKKLAA